ncbi:hypothetical protein MtrunA17_Chr5g0421681 [Medicago truncatula]|uniref:Uncharacterized protein n=1 Tax=Medicago truncatula TaxID=3880 RepID=A0A396HTE1_MEDTR|nr:hypothetical protein MtrunA17_Chr5g0421681 [Medicago truncatula]
MAFKRGGKEGAISSGEPPPKKQVAAKNHGITFKNNKQWDSVAKYQYTKRTIQRVQTVALKCNIDEYHFIGKLGV